MGFLLLSMINVVNVLPAFCGNYKSVLSDNVKSKVEKQIIDEINLNRYVVCLAKTFNCQCLGGNP